METTRTFEKTPAQSAAVRLLGGPERHTLLYGGSRSGKTFIALRSVLIRAFKERSRHAIWRLRFNHIKSSIWSDTLPKVLTLCFPGVPVERNKTDLILTLPNGSEVWLGGLDNEDRVEKVLGQEFSTVYFNECSQIPYDSVTTALSRLAERSGLTTRAYYDCNPPSKSHWTYKLFIEGKDPESGRKVEDGVYSHMRLNPSDNVENLSPDYLAMLARLPVRKRARFLAGEFTDDREGALWTYAIIRHAEAPKQFKRVVVAVDPAASNKVGSDETGIVKAGIDFEGRGWVLADASRKGSPTEWARSAKLLAEAKPVADAIVAEVNNGGDMVEHTIRSVGYQGRVIKVHASRGKAVRAEPISALYEQGMVWHAEDFETLEEQMADFTIDFDRTEAGYSPDRLDALVWALTELMLKPEAKRRLGIGAELIMA